MQCLPRVPARRQPEPLVLCTVLRAEGLVSSLRRLVRRGNPFTGDGGGGRGASSQGAAIQDCPLPVTLDVSTGRAGQHRGASFSGCRYPEHLSRRNRGPDQLQPPPRSVLRHSAGFSVEMMEGGHSRWPCGHPPPTPDPMWLQTPPSVGTWLVCPLPGRPHAHPTPVVAGPRGRSFPALSRSQPPTLSPRCHLACVFPTK